MSDRRKTKVIGLTGMSGAGKSTACKMFREAGFYVIDCDGICREIVKKGKPCLKEIASGFGSEILTAEGELNRRLMGKIIFSDPDKRIKLNGIMYPFVSYSVIKRIIFSDSEYTVLDAPTLFESGLEDICGKIVSVAADKEILINRITVRHGITREEAKNRLDSQYDADFFREKSDILIMNNGSEEEFSREIKKTICRIKEGK